MDVRKELYELFNDPLLDGVRPKVAAATAGDRMQQKLAEVNDWIAMNGREPRKDGNLKEKLMYAAMMALRNKL
ncbi:MAG: hypothetical protein IKQ37_07905 [Bacteroidaceae bacterium]|nr:hypothetical protein [Bacteroidaceae bacterium]